MSGCELQKKRLEEDRLEEAKRDAEAEIWRRQQEGGESDSDGSMESENEKDDWGTSPMDLVTSQWDVEEGQWEDERRTDGDLNERGDSKDFYLVDGIRDHEGIIS